MPKEEFVMEIKEQVRRKGCKLREQVDDLFSEAVRQFEGLGLSISEFKVSMEVVSIFWKRLKMFGMEMWRPWME